MKKRTTLLPNTGIQMVGWKEDPEILKKAFSYILKAHNYNHFIFVSDGNSKDDMYIQDIFLKSFPSQKLILSF